MPTTKKQSQRLGNIVFVVVVAVVAFWAGHSIKINSASTQVTPSTSPSPSVSIITSAPDGSASPTMTSTSTTIPGQLLVASQSGGTTQLTVVDPVHKTRKVVFTDKDTALKIKQIGNATSDGSEVIVTMGAPSDDFGTSLWLIATDGSAKQSKLIDDLSTPSSPAISPDGKRIAYLTFSNAEKDYGFSLIIANRDGSNAKTLARETTPITQPVFSPKGDQIAYLREQNPKGGSILTVPITGGKTKQVASYQDRVPYDLAWSVTDTFAFVDGTGSQAKLYELPKGANEPVLLSTGSARVSHPLFSPDGSFLAYADAGKTGTIVIYDQDQKTNETIGAGTLPLGWVPGRGA